MVLNSISIFILFFLLTSCNSSTQEITNTSTPEEKGFILYTKHCSSCHGENGKLGISGAKDLSSSTLSKKEMFKLISNGKNAMPPMKTRFKDSSEIYFVISHIKKFKKP